MKGLKNKLVLVLTVIFMLNAVMALPIFAGEAPSLPPTGNIKPGVLVNDKLIGNLGANPLISKIAQDAIARGVKPGTFQNVTYTLRRDVELLSNDAVQSIKSNTKDGIMDAAGLKGFVPDGKKTYVDKSSGLAFQLLKGTDNKTYIYTADQKSIVEDINIPDQTVFLNEANITSLTEGIRFNVLSTYSTQSSDSGNYQLSFDKSYTLPGFDQDGKKVEVKLKGSINIIKPYLETEYTAFDGYKCIFNAGERAEVSAQLYADVEKEVKVPLIEFGVPGGDICTAGVGVFLVISVDGTINMEYSFNQHYELKAGLKGGTCLYIPTGIDVVLEKDFGFDTKGLTLSAQIKAEACVSAEVALKVLGKVDISINAKLGVKLEVKCDYGGNSNLLSLRADGFFSINGRLKVKSFDKSVELLSYKFPLFNITKEPKPTYVIHVTEACAYRDSIKGIIEKVTGTDSTAPYGDKQITIMVTGNGSPVQLNVLTDSKGEFSASCNLVNGSKVSVKIPDTGNSWTESVKATFPFTNVAIEKVDYYDNIVKGYVSGDETGGFSYTGPIKISVIERENIPAASAEQITLPVSHTVNKQVNSVNGSFSAGINDLRPYDIVYAYIDYDGFMVSSRLMEADGLDTYVSGNYVQEPDKLYSQGGTIVLGGSYVKAAPSGGKGAGGTTANMVVPKPPITPGLLAGLNKVEPSGNIKYRVRVFWPHGKNADIVREKEWTLPLARNTQGIVTAVIGPWEMDLQDMTAAQFIPPVDLAGYIGILGGDGAVRYHVNETVEYFYEGKRIEITSEALECDCERAREGARLPDLSAFHDSFTSPGDIAALNYGELLERIHGMDIMLPGIAPGTPMQAIPYMRGAATITDSGKRIPQGPSNFSCSVSVKRYSSINDTKPEVSEWNLKVLDDSAKINSGNNSILIFRSLRRQVSENNELSFAKNVRYEGEDCLTELDGLRFTRKGEQTINNILCDVYEKSNAGAAIKVYEWKGKGVPVKVQLDNDGWRIELTFSDYVFNRVTKADFEY